MSAESAATVREGVTAAPAAGAGTPELADQILIAAQSAFTDAYNVIGVVGGLALLAMAVVARRVLVERETPEVVEEEPFLETTAA
jgi:DHA2 family multidrug resistance protein-like MFS transporter